MAESDSVVLSLPPDLSGVIQARRLVAQACEAAGIDDSGPVLVVDELAANAVLHAGHFGGYKVSIDRRDGLLWIRVSDGYPCRLPDTGDGDPWAESGRGLRIAKSVAACFNYRITHEGKTLAVAFKIPGDASSPTPGG